MAHTIPNLWPTDDITVDLVSPVAVLRTQASLLGEMTQGLLQGSISTVTSDDGRVQHQFDVVVPALGGYRHRLITISHDREMVYPVRVDWDRSSVEKLAYKQAATHADFVYQIQSALQSPSTVSTIQSLIARSNDQAA